VTRAARLAPLLAAALAGCQADPPPCPGDAQGSLSFRGTVRAAQPGEIPCALIPSGSTTAFPATVSFTSDTEGALCLSRLLTEPRRCARAGDQLSGCASGPQEVQHPDCPCAIGLQETLAGSLLRTGTRLTGFSGTLEVTLTRSASAATCYAAEDARATQGKCPPADGCSARYDVSGAP